MKDFYPTPIKLIEKMLSGIKFEKQITILEPSAGKGDICDYIKNNNYFRDNIDVIEIEPDLQATLKGKEYNVIFDDFLKFETHKNYDLIVANFPFGDGDKHLQKAIELQEIAGGTIICLVNAETIKNPYTNLRKLIIDELEKYNASIEYLTDEFIDAERKTKVEVALIKLTIEKENSSIILDGLKKEYVHIDENVENQIIEKDFLKALIARFNFECKLGIKIIDEYFSLKPYLTDEVKKTDYPHLLIELKVEDGYETKSSYINGYIRGVRGKYWELLLGNDDFRGKYTSNLLNDIEEKITELKDCDFNDYNIKTLEIEMSKKVNISIEKTILDLFDEMSRKHAYGEDFNKNIHYYNGWKTNKAHKINERVILPIWGFSNYSFEKSKLDTWRVKEKMEDIVKVFNYLVDEVPEINRLVGGTVEIANNMENFRNMDFFYFTATFFKKGTCHITFKDKKLLDKFNIFGSQRKGWLPPSYGKKKYSDMEKEEQSAVDEFQGEEEYKKVMNEKDYYLVKDIRLKLLN